MKLLFKSDYPKIDLLGLMLRYDKIILSYGHGHENLAWVLREIPRYDFHKEDLI